MTLLELLSSALVANGIGEFLRPISIRRNASATRDALYQERLMLAELEAQMEAVRDGRSTIVTLPDGKRTIRPTADPEEAHSTTPAAVRAPLPTGAPARALQLAERALAFAAAESIRREVNVEHAILAAQEALLGDAAQVEESSQQIDRDWLFRWRDSAAQYTSEELRQLWGSILAKETKNPGSFSFRALDFLKNVSSAEARLIERIAPLEISGGIFWGDRTIFQGMGIPFAALLELENIGVLSGVSGGLTRTFKSLSTDSFHLGTLIGGLVVIAKHPDPNKEVQLPFLMLTSVGREIIALGKGEPSLSYITAFARGLSHQGCAVTIAEVIRTDLDGRVTYQNERPLDQT